MILPIALAKNKFIDCNENAQLNETSLDFLECLKRVFNFEERDSGCGFEQFESG